jgi:hypothetical protein
VNKVFDALRRDGDGSNTIMGIIILIMLLVFVGPDVLPQLLADTVPFIDEGVPCNFLRTTQDRSQHQSLIGRAAQDPLTLEVEFDTLRQDGLSTWTVRIIVINDTIGTVPIVFNENQVLVSDDSASSGVGLIFTPPIGISLDTNRDGIPNTRPQNLVSFPETDIRLLGPRQRCVQRVILLPEQQNAIQMGVTSVRAYYRITGAGAFPVGTVTLYPDQGLDILVENTLGGFVESDAVVITNDNVNQ